MEKAFEMQDTSEMTWEAWAAWWAVHGTAPTDPRGPLAERGVWGPCSPVPGCNPHALSDAMMARQGVNNGGYEVSEFYARPH